MGRSSSRLDFRSKFTSAAFFHFFSSLLHLCSSFPVEVPRSSCPFSFVVVLLSSKCRLSISRSVKCPASKHVDSEETVRTRRFSRNLVTRRVGDALKKKLHVRVKLPESKRNAFQPFSSRSITVLKGPEGFQAKSSAR